MIWASVGGYLSTGLLLFATFGLLSKGSRALRLILLAWIVLALARMYGTPPVLGSILGVLPGMSRVVFYRYATSSVEFAAIVLAALGLDDLLAAPLRARRVAAVTGALLLLIAFAAVWAHSLAGQLGSKFAGRPYFAGSIAWGVAVLLAGAAVVLLRRPRARVWLATALVAADALVLFMIPEAAAPRAVQLDLAPVSFLQRNLGTSRAYTFGPLAPNYGSYFGVGLLNINDLPVPSAFNRYIHAHLDPYSPPAAFVGTPGGRGLFTPSPAQELMRNLSSYRGAAVKYVLAPAGQLLPQGADGLRLVFRSPSTWIYRLAGSDPYFTATGGRCRVTASGREAAQLSCAAPSELIRRETYMPGWSAEVDGHAVAVREVDGLYQEVPVGAGVHRVTFGFAPPHIELGVLALIAGLVAWVASGIYNRRRSRAG